MKNNSFSKQTTNSFRIFGIAILFFISLTGMAQSQTTKTISEEERLAGTYEIISKTKIEEVFTTDIFAEIEKRRDDTKEVLYEISPLTTIKILPRSVINSPEFVKPKQN